VTLDGAALRAAVTACPNLNGIYVLICIYTHGLKPPPCMLYPDPPAAVRCVTPCCAVYHALLCGVSRPADLDLRGVRGLVEREWSLHGLVRPLSHPTPYFFTLPITSLSLPYTPSPPTTPASHTATVTQFFAFFYWGGYSDLIASLPCRVN
jgi:hypothetical protein